MSPFTNESQLRNKFHLADTNKVPSEMITAAIDQAHTEILQVLHPDVATDPVPPALAAAATLLAGARLFAALAAAYGVSQRSLSFAGNRIDQGNQTNALLTAANLIEKMAWQLLEPFLASVPHRPICNTTDSQTL